METPQIRQVLSELRFSSGLSEGDLHKLAEISRLVEFPAGSTIFVEGSEATTFYLLRCGRVELCMNVPASGCLPIITLEEGDVLGWSVLLDQGAMTATATAVTETKAIVLAADDLRKLCEEDHDIGFEFMRRIAVALAQRLIATRLQVLDMFAAAPQTAAEKTK